MKAVSSPYLSTERKDDNRLFPGELLYCEGQPKPYFRGFLHLIFAILLPFGIWHFYLEANGNRKAQIVGCFYVFTNFLCYGASALLHVGKWSVRSEIIVQKLDHCAIALLSMGTMYPVAFLLLDKYVGFSFAFLTTCACLWNLYYLILHARPSVFRQAMVPATVLPFLPFCFLRMNYIEWSCTLLCIVFQSMGISIFVRKHPNPFPEYVGYHELFHGFVVLAGICVYLCNWSVVRRTSNPYARHLDVLEILWNLFASYIMDFWPF